MSNIVYDGDFTVAKPVSAIRYGMPIPGVNKAYVAEQDFCMRADQFAPLTVGVQHPTLSGFYLMSESSPTPTTAASIVRWTRTYAKVPDTHSLPGSVNYTFIGYVGDNTFDGRQRFTTNVAARVQFDYYRLDGTHYAAIEDIPVEEEQKYYGGFPNAVNLRLFTDLIFYNSQAAVPSTPSRDDYEGWIADNKAILAGAKPINPADLHELVATGSELELWMGNIVRRKTVFILPQ